MSHDKTQLLPCMGGWCGKREHCANYQAGSAATAPQERICEPNRDGHAPWAVVIPLHTAPSRAAQLETAT